MALFGSKKKTTEEKAVEAVAAQSVGVRSDVSHVLKNPRITEKASLHQNTGVYTFDVAQSATKTQIAHAVREVYKVSPQKVRIVQVPSKTTRSARTGRAGVKSGGKKAYVYLKNGESITIA
jgi:large subunit ribosomal protein L23